MSGALLVLGPLVGCLALGLRPIRERATLVLLAVSSFTTATALAGLVWTSNGAFAAGYAQFDTTSRLFAAFVNPIFAGISVYVWSRVSATAALRRDIVRFVAWSTVFLAATNAVLVANHLFAMWIAFEFTTLAITPLVVRRGHASSRTASFHYLLFSSVGLGLAFLGFVCLARGMTEAGQAPDFHFERLEVLASATRNRWGQLGLALALLGLGTKLGLVPMYSWLPDTYDHAPSAVAAMLGAVQFNAALLVLLRVVHAFRPAHPALIMNSLVTLGLASMAISTISIIATHNLKRLVAYASINHAGVIAIGLGIGRPAAFGMLLYVISNAFIKSVLFLTAGKIKAHYGTKDTREIAGLLKDLPYSGVFLMVGTFALLGFPPFGSFLGELLILSALISSGHVFVFSAFCLLITVSFVATGKTIFPMIWGESKHEPTWPRQTLLAAAPKLIFVLALVVLGVYIPARLGTLLEHVAAYAGGAL